MFVHISRIEADMDPIAIWYFAHCDLNERTTKGAVPDCAVVEQTSTPECCFIHKVIPLDRLLEWTRTGSGSSYPVSSEQSSNNPVVIQPLSLKWQKMSVEWRFQRSYFEEAVEQQFVLQSVVNQATAAWWHCFRLTDGRLPLPATSAGPDGKLMYSWDNGEHHLEFEFAEDSGLEIFYRNRLDERLWEDVIDATTLDADDSTFDAADAIFGQEIRDKLETVCIG